MNQWAWWLASLAAESCVVMEFPVRDVGDFLSHYAHLLMKAYIRVFGTEGELGPPFMLPPAVGETVGQGGPRCRHECWDLKLITTKRSIYSTTLFITR